MRMIRWTLLVGLSLLFGSAQGPAVASSPPAAPHSGSTAAATFARTATAQSNPASAAPANPAATEQSRVAAPAAAPIKAPPAVWAAPTDVRAKDTPNDGGKNITVQWKGVSGSIRYRVERAEPDSAFHEVGTAGPSESAYLDNSVPADNQPFRYRVISVGPNGGEGVSDPSNPAASRAQVFNGYLLGVLIAVLGFMAMVIWFIRKARSGAPLFIRKIAGLEAVDEAVGRATEMGKPVLFIPGTGSISDIATIATLNVLGEIAKKTATFGTAILVPNFDPIVYTVAREVVKGAYVEVGRPDSYDVDSVFFLVQDALVYAAAVSGIMEREKPAANFLLGTFYGEALILAETGASTGAIQIAGTDMTTQLPFFVVACDYTLIGEELYAASAYLSREPLMLGALKGEDWGKVVFIALLIVGTIVSLLFGVNGTRILATSGF